MDSLPRQSLLELFNRVLAHKGRDPLAELHPTDRLREDIGFDSLDLAELTVRIEDRFGVDVFADGVVRTVGEVEARLAAGQNPRSDDRSGAFV